MSFSVISFALWAIFMLALVGGFMLKTRHSKQIQQKAEDVASEALPEIGHIAEVKYKERFGCAPPDAPGNPEAWYPEVKKKVAKASG